MKSIMLMFIVGMALLISSCQEQSQSPVVYSESQEAVEPADILALPAMDESIRIENNGSDYDIPQCILLPELPDWPTAKFDLKSAATKGDVMSVTVSYRGGDILHEFRLVVSTTIEDSEPLQILAQVFHTPVNDPGNQRITEVRRFDISPLKKFLFEKYKNANCLDTMINFENGGRASYSTAYNVCRE